MQITIEQFIKVPEAEKSKYFCVERTGFRYKVSLNTSGHAYCERCGATPNDAIVRTSTEYCQPCYRALNTDSYFVKD